MPRYWTTITGDSYEAMLDLVRKYHVDVLDHGQNAGPEGRYSVEAFMESKQIESLKALGYKIEEHGDIDEIAKRRQAEVGVGDRYRKQKP